MNQVERVQRINDITGSTLPNSEKIRQLTEFVKSEKKADETALSEVKNAALKDTGNEPKGDIANQIFELLRGDKGADGVTPTKEELVALITPLIPQPLKGKDSTVPGPVGKMGPQGKPGKDGKDGKDGADGKDGIDGDDAELKIETVVKAVVKYFKSQKGKDRLNIKHIDGLDKFVNDANNAIRNGVTYQSVGRVIGGSNLSAGSGIIISSSGVISSTGSGGSLSIETPIGTQNGSNKTFTVSNTPAFLILNGQVLTGGGVDYTISGLTITTINAPLVGDVFRSYYF